jgi:hypothetical protein
MHDIDTTQLEFGEETAWESPETYAEEWEAEAEGDFEADGEPEIDPEALLDEGEIEELAGDMLGVSSEQELDQFLGRFLHRLVRRAAGGPVGAFLQQAPGCQAFKGLAGKTPALPERRVGSVIPASARTNQRDELRAYADFIDRVFCRDRGWNETGSASARRKGSHSFLGVDALAPVGHRGVPDDPLRRRDPRRMRTPVRRRLRNRIDGGPAARTADPDGPVTDIDGLDESSQVGERGPTKHFRP